MTKHITMYKHAPVINSTRPLKLWYSRIEGC